VQRVAEHDVSAGVGPFDDLELQRRHGASVHSTRRGIASMRRALPSGRQRPAK
jgi:hypothetical protein